MINDLRTAALRRYHETFDPAQYNTIAHNVASNLNIERDDARVADGVLMGLRLDNSQTPRQSRL